MKNETNNYCCIICGNTHFTIPFNSAEYLIRECTRCKFGMIDPVPNETRLSELYNSPVYFSTHMHHHYDALTDSELQQLIDQQGRLHYNHLRPWFFSGMTLLEIGCGYGLQLVYLQSKGAVVKGVEFSSNASEFCKNRLHLQVENSELENYSDPSTYDVVMLNHVLEHFTDLHLAMKKICSLVKPGGIVYIRVPNHDSYDRRKLGSEWPAYLPFHISYFSSKCLRQLFQNYALQPIAVDEYISDAFMQNSPAYMKVPIKKIISRSGLTPLVNGRTITIIGKNAA